jgi:hypothetical protein
VFECLKEWKGPNHRAYWGTPFNCSAWDHLSAPCSRAIARITPAEIMYHVEDSESSVRSKSRIDVYSKGCYIEMDILKAVMKWLSICKKRMGNVPDCLKMRTFIHRRFHREGIYAESEVSKVDPLLSACILKWTLHIQQTLCIPTNAIWNLGNYCSRDIKDCKGMHRADLTFRFK